MKQQSKNKLTLSVVSMSALLVLSACSGDKTAEETATVNESASTTAVTEDVPATKPDAATSDTEIQAESAETSAVTNESGQDVTAESEVVAADAGATLYESNCKVCHDAGLLNAPKYGDKAAWTARLGKDKETLYMHSAKGFNKMPAQAVDGVTEAQVKAAVDYMLASVS